MTDTRFYIFAGGGTGGHVFPGLAVAEQLASVEPDAAVVFACSSRAIDRRILTPTGHAFVAQPVRPLPRRPWHVPAFLRAWRASKKLAAELVTDLQPKAVLGLGGFAAAPVVRAAARRGISTALLNPDAVPGRANKHLAGAVDAIFTQFASTAETFGPRHRGKVQCVGCPVRESFAEADRAEALKHFDLQDDRRTLVVLGGSLGARNINAALAALLGELADLGDQWQILHVTGPAKQAGAEEHPAGLTVRRLEFCHRMDLAYAAADLVLARAGAGTVAELSATGRPAVLMPYPYHKDQHQRLNAADLVSAGAAAVCEDRKDPALNAAGLRETLVTLLRDADRLADMTRAAAAGAARADAAVQVASWLAEQ